MTTTLFHKMQCRWRRHHRRDKPWRNFYVIPFGRKFTEGENLRYRESESERVKFVFQQSNSNAWMTRTTSLNHHNLRFWITSWQFKHRLIIMYFVKRTFLFLCCSYILTFVITEKVYTDEFAVHIRGGRSVADELALKYGYVNKGQVCMNSWITFFFI